MCASNWVYEAPKSNPSDPQMDRKPRSSAHQSAQRVHLDCQVLRHRRREVRVSGAGQLLEPGELAQLLAD